MGESPQFPPKPAAGAGRSWPILLPLGIFGAVISFFLLIICSGGFTAVSGTQFHVDGFQIRRFTAFRLPLVGIQVGKTSYSDETPRLSQLLVDQGWIRKPQLQPPEEEWALIELNESWHGLPTNLTDYLRQDRSRLDLYAWSTANPRLAAMLWSEVEQAARLQLYWMAPPMIEAMVDISRRNPISKQRDETGRAELAQRRFTTFLLDSYQKTEQAAKAADQPQLAADCRKQVERLQTQGVMLFPADESPEKPTSEKPQSSQPATKSEPPQQDETDDQKAE